MGWKASCLSEDHTPKGKWSGPSRATKSEAQKDADAHEQLTDHSNVLVGVET